LPGKVAETKEYQNEKDIFFEKYVELLAGSRLFCGAIHSSVRLHWAKNNLERGNIYFE
jgi:hypothetical protein